MYSESTERQSALGSFTYMGIGPNGQEQILTSLSWYHLPSPFSNCCKLGCESHKTECLTLWMKPVPKPRETQADRWKKRPSVLRYRFLRDVIRNVMEHYSFVPSCELGLIFYMQMPKWSKVKKERMIGSPHMKRPDLDNLEKATVDALFQNAEDAVVHRKMAMKKWSSKPHIEIWNL
jgi:Holliday junction resolvase RusA-like endonuclease